MNNDIEIHVVDLYRTLLFECNSQILISCLAIINVASELRGRNIGLRRVEAAVVDARHLLCARYSARCELEEARNIV